MNCVILYNRALERYEAHEERGRCTWAKEFVICQGLMKQLAYGYYTEVSLNSTAGQRILAKIGEVKE